MLNLLKKINLFGKCVNNMHAKLCTTPASPASCSHGTLLVIVQLFLFCVCKILSISQLLTSSFARFQFGDCNCACNCAMPECNSINCICFTIDLGGGGGGAQQQQQQMTQQQLQQQIQQLQQLQRQQQQFPQQLAYPR